MKSITYYLNMIVMTNLTIEIKYDGYVLIINRTKGILLGGWNMSDKKEPWYKRCSPWMIKYILLLAVFIFLYLAGKFSN
jgi:hypothetical protein